MMMFKIRITLITECVFCSWMNLSEPERVNYCCTQVELHNTEPRRSNLEIRFFGVRESDDKPTACAASLENVGPKVVIK